MLRGYLDVANLQRVAGWALDDAQPEVPVCLLVTDNDKLIGRFRADRHRADLEEAGVGSGNHGFEFEFSERLAPLEMHVMRVRREYDGAELAQSPATIEPTQVLDAPAQDALADIIGRYGSDEAKIDFLMNQVELALQQLGDRDSRRSERAHYRHLLQRWRRRSADAMRLDAATFIPRALVIDDRIPRSDRDAGSTAILSHMQSLQRLGYEVVFTPAIDFAAADQNSAALDAIGVTCCRAPYYGSIEEVLRRQAGQFDLVYLHRVSNAAKYGQLARYHNPKARQFFGVADLHHLRYARQADAEGRPELVELSRRMRFFEHVAAASVDAVITHSAREAEVLAKLVPSSKVHTVMWSTTPKPTQIPFTQRSGVAFIGGYGHAPNLDAARWLIHEIMPLVRERRPSIECLLVGSDMPVDLRRLCKDGVVPVGYVRDLDEIFDRVRLTVAPLTYGAGIKGKVIDSLSAGLPCVCTPVAAEGIDFPEALQACVAKSAKDLAALICDLHDNEQMNQACGRAGVDYVRMAFSNERLDAALRQMLGPIALSQSTPIELERTEDRRERAFGKTE